jgi:hypothetical protein
VACKSSKLNFVCLLPLGPEQLETVEELKEAMGGEKLLKFVSEKFSE